MTIIAHISDPHLDGSPRNQERAERVARYLSVIADHVDAVVLTGDVTDHGAASEYAVAKSIFDLPVPVVFLPGNHDDRAKFRRVLLGQTELPAKGKEPPINQALDIAELTILLADSTVPGEDYGTLAPSTLTWLRECLSRTDRATLIALHHPPLEIGYPDVDGDQGLRNRADLAGLVHAAPHVIGILAGHVHTGVASTFAGVPVCIVPGIASTIVMPWESAIAPGVFADQHAPPGLSIHRIEGKQIITHFRSVVDRP